MRSKPDRASLAQTLVLYAKTYLPPSSVDLEDLIFQLQ